MNFIIGGAYQGKKEYTIEKYSLSKDDISDGEFMNIDDISGLKCITNYHLLVKNVMENNGDPMDTAEKILHNNPNIIIIMNEIGNGIIPFEKSERIWREQVGRVGCYFARSAEKVIRITCGISTIIKG